MGNCLVTKLKGVVNNDNLEKLGVIVLTLTNTDGNVAVRYSVDGGVLRLTNATIDEYTEIPLVKDVVYSTNTKVITDASLGYYKVEIPKYNLNYLDVSGIGNTVNADKLEYVDNEVTLALANISVSGSFESIIEKIVAFYAPRTVFSNEFDLTQMGANGKLTQFVMNNVTTGVKGSLNNLGKSYSTLDKSVGHLILPDSKNMTMSIEGFVANARTAGDATGSITFPYINTISATFNNAEISDENAEVSWTANTITCNGVTIDA